MKHRFLEILLLLVFFISPILAEKDPVIVTIDNKQITKNEFLRLYNKNNTNPKYDLKSLQEYMDLFINFKLKVIEAEHLGFDTVPSFKSEYKSYREELIRPYLTDKEMEEKLVNETYKRLLEEVRVRQIFIAAGELLPPSDTLIYFNKAVEAYNKLKAGEPWDSVYLKYNQDPSTIKTNGDLGYFCGMQMFYPIENVCYNMKVGEISFPVRTKYGYYINQLLDRRPSKGEIKIKHIMVAYPENATRVQIDSAKRIIDEVYSKLKAGEDFSELARKYSDDKRSAQKGGEINWFGVGQMIKEFETAAFSLQNNGDYTPPFRTAFGWHIIQRIATRPIAPLDSMKENLKARLSRGDRADIIQASFIEKTKKRYGFKEDLSKLKMLEDLIDTSVFKGLWDAKKAEGLSNVTLFTIGDKSYSVYDFAKYMSRYRFKKPATIEMSINHFYDLYKTKVIKDYANSQVENSYPEVKYLLQEYHDGILLFNLMEQKIWTVAAQDSVELMKYYNQNKDTYKWGDRVEALVVSSPDKALVEKAYTFADDFLAGKVSADDILKNVCNDANNPCLNCQVNLFEKDDNRILDSLGWEIGITPIIFKENKYGFFVKKNITPARIKTFDEAEGTVIADYQVFLEKQYVSQLKNKYKVQVNEDVLKSLVKK